MSTQMRSCQWRLSHLVLPRWTGQPHSLQRSPCSPSPPPKRSSLAQQLLCPTRSMGQHWCTSLETDGASLTEAPALGPSPWPRPISQSLLLPTGPSQGCWHAVAWQRALPQQQALARWHKEETALHSLEWLLLQSSRGALGQDSALRQCQQLHSWLGRR